jgi:hypothetical protein
MKNFWFAEPTMILAVIQSFVALFISFGLDLSNQQVGAIMAAAAALLGLLARSRVTPNEPKSNSNNSIN